MIAEEGLPCVIVQPGGVYGPGDTSQVADLLERVPRRQDCRCCPSPSSASASTHVEDIAGGILLGARQGQARRDLRDQRPGDDDARGDRDRRRGQRPQGAQARRCRPALMKAMTPIGPLVGKMMGQPPNLRELISSADGVTFWASYDKAEPRARLRPARPRGGPARRRSKPTSRFPAPRRLSRPRADARNRRHAPRAAARDRLLGGRRGARRPRPGVLAGDPAGGARRRAAAGAAAHPHPPRPRRRDRGAGAALARARGLRPRARRPAPDRPLEAAGQRRAPLRRPDGAPLGRDRAGARRPT